jgi:class 3 adenylate cyclase
MVSFLFTDIEGSTRIFASLGDAYHDLLADHNRLLRRVWVDHGGYEVRTEGDAFFVAFESAAKALDASVAAQRALHQYEWPLAAPRIRAGVHSGLGVAVDDDYVALAVHQAARVVGAAHGGQCLATAATVELADGRSLAETRSLGPFRLRSFDEPVLLYQVSLAGEDLDFPPLRAVPADGHNIVRPLTTFVGRDGDLADVIRLIDESPLVTILGSGGVGKTRLAAEVGTRVASSFDGGVWLTDLSSTEPGGSVGSVVASAIGVQPGGRDPVVALAESLGMARALLILDTCEHVRDSVREIANSLLGASPNLRILATSRAPLGLDYERVWQLKPLPVDEDGGEAERLFIDRIGRDPTPAEKEAVAELVQRLEGIPLAIELAAARARIASPEAVLSMFDDPSRLLRVRHHGAGGRQVLGIGTYALPGPSGRTAHIAGYALPESVGVRPPPALAIRSGDSPP